MSHCNNFLTTSAPIPLEPPVTIATLYGIKGRSGTKNCYRIVYKI